MKGMATKGKPAKRKSPKAKAVRPKPKEKDIEALTSRLIRKRKTALDKLASLD